MRKAGLKPGTLLRVEVERSGRLLLARHEDPVLRYAGILRYPKGYLRKLRGEWRA
ncbi:MAG TPA: hypothetical protein VGR87_14600 [Candidatus Limnocylindria bacterium]|nr:hypothetical protein [Candidatus Limnocylindria bacterium]